ncbi:MAG: low temperature requirement protein A [Dehalococcoidia bacterium]
MELFFDLVFVFAVTEVTAFTLDHLDWGGVARSTLVFWMIWWAWTQWTWALNPADTTHLVVRVATLFATAVAFLMAASVHAAFDEAASWFAATYVIVRVIGLLVYALVASESHDRLHAVAVFAFASVAGLVVVLIGAMASPEARPWWWLAAVLLDLGAAAVGGRQRGWDLHAGHFAERHGLFVIIALGESLIVVGLTVAGSEKNNDLLAVAIGAVAVVCLLWWTYFGWLHGALEVALHAAHDDAALARDAFSLIYFPLIGGVIGIAAGFEEMVHHPAERLDPVVLRVLAVGLLLFAGGAALAWFRVSSEVLVPRLLIATVTTIVLLLAGEAQPVALLTLVVIALVAIAVVEGARPSGATREPALTGDPDGGR